MITEYKGRGKDITGWVMSEHGVPESRLTVVGYVETRKYQQKNRKAVAEFWECKCDCGNPVPKTFNKQNILRGLVLSCGCIQRELQNKKRESYFCQICGASAKDDPHFNFSRNLCNRHSLQIRQGKNIIREKKRGLAKDIECCVCGERSKLNVCYVSGDFYGKTVCAKHYVQILKNGFPLDNKRPEYIIRKKEKCCVCGSGKNTKFYGEETFCSIHAPTAEGAYNPYKDCGEIINIGSFDKFGNLKKEWATIDKDDFDKVKEYRWYLSPVGYYTTRINKKETPLHRFLIGDGDFIVDHIDRNPLNNKKDNLRKTDIKINSYNRGCSSANTSGVVGVSYNNSQKHYEAYININGKRIHLGKYKEFDKAARRRLLAERDLAPQPPPQLHLFAKYGIEYGDKGDA